MEQKEWIKLTAEAAPDALDTMVAIFSLVDDSLLIEGGDFDLPEMTFPEEAPDFVPPETAKVSLFLPKEEDPSETLSFLKARLEEAGVSATLSLDGIAESDYLDNWKQYYHRFEVGPITVLPAWEEYTPKEGEKLLRIDPGTAYGTGTHESTRMVMEMLAETVRGGERYLDLGCGSGILAIEALLLGVGPAAAYDIDPEAVRVTRENMALHGFDCPVGVSDLLSGVDMSLAPFDLITANIIADVLIPLAKDAPALLAQGGHIILSGIIHHRASDVRDAYLNAGLSLVKDEERRDWHAMIFRKEA